MSKDAAITKAIEALELMVAMTPYTSKKKREALKALFEALEVPQVQDNWQQYAQPGETAQQCIERQIELFKQASCQWLNSELAWQDLTDSQINRITRKHWLTGSLASHRAYARDILAKAKEINCD